MSKADEPSNEMRLFKNLNEMRLFKNHNEIRLFKNLNEMQQTKVLFVIIGKNRIKNIN